MNMHPAYNLISKIDVGDRVVDYKFAEELRKALFLNINNNKI
jgi:hypothetical protein